MAGAIATAFVEVRPQTENFGRTLESETGAAATQAGTSIGRRIGEAVVAVGVGRMLADSLGEAAEAQEVLHQTEAVIRSTGGAAQVSAEQASTLADRLSRVAAVDNDVIQAGENMLMTFTRVRNEVGEGNNIFDRGTEAALNMSAAMGGDLQGAVVMVGKALNDPIAGITAMTRAGVQFTQQQKDQIAAMVEAGDQLGAQRIILGELETQFGGSAAAQATALDRLTVASGNMKESVGTALLPIIERAVPMVERLVDVFEDLPAPLQTAIVAGVGFGAVARPINDVLNVTSRLGPILRNAEGAMTSLGKAGVVLAGIGLAATFAQWGREMSTFTVDIEKAAEATTDSLVDAFNHMAEIEDQFGGDVQLNFFQQLVEGSDASRQSAVDLRDALAGAGQDVSELDRILASEADSQARATERTDEGRTALDAYGTSAEGAAGAVDHVRRMVDDFTDALTESYEQLFGQQDATAAWQAALDDLTESIHENGSSLDLNTEKGRANFQAGREAGQALVELMQRRLDETGSIRAATDAGNLYVEQLRGQLRQAGLTEAQVQEYIDTLHLVPAEVASTIVVHTAEAVREVQELQRQIAGVTAGSHEVNVAVNFVTRGPKSGGKGGTIIDFGGGDSTPGGDVASIFSDFFRSTTTHVGDDLVRALQDEDAGLERWISLLDQIWKQGGVLTAQLLGRLDWHTAIAIAQEINNDRALLNRIENAAGDLAEDEANLDWLLANGPSMVKVPGTSSGGLPAASLGPVGLKPGTPQMPNRAKSSAGAGGTGPAVWIANATFQDDVDVEMVMKQAALLVGSGTFR